MLGSLYKRNGDLNRAIELFLQSIEESHNNGDDLGVLNSLNALIDLFLYWNIPEYANLYATDALSVEQNMAMKNPMVSAQEVNEFLNFMENRQEMVTLTPFILK